jgi:hypothetical protein
MSKLLHASGPGSATIMPERALVTGITAQDGACLAELLLGISRMRPTSSVSCNRYSLRKFTIWRPESRARLVRDARVHGAFGCPRNAASSRRSAFWAWRRKPVSTRPPRRNVWQGAGNAATCNHLLLPHAHLTERPRSTPTGPRSTIVRLTGCLPAAAFSSITSRRSEVNRS